MTHELDPEPDATTHPNESVSDPYDPVPDAVGPYEAATYLGLTVNDWLKVIESGQIRTIAHLSSFVRRDDLHAYGKTVDDIRKKELTLQAEQQGVAEPDPKAALPRHPVIATPWLASIRPPVTVDPVPGPPTLRQRIAQALRQLANSISGDSPDQ